MNLQLTAVFVFLGLTEMNVDFYSDHRSYETDKLNSQLKSSTFNDMRQPTVTHYAQVAATVELTQEGSADCELNNNNGNSCSDSRVQTQLLTPLRSDIQLTNHGKF